MARKNVRKTTFHSTFEMIQLQPIREQKNKRKAFEGASVEPTKTDPRANLEQTQRFDFDVILHKSKVKLSIRRRKYAKETT